MSLSRSRSKTKLSSLSWAQLFSTNQWRMAQRILYARKLDTELDGGNGLNVWILSLVSLSTIRMHPLLPVFPLTPLKAYNCACAKPSTYIKLCKLSSLFLHSSKFEQLFETVPHTLWDLSKRNNKCAKHSQCASLLLRASMVRALNEKTRLCAGMSSALLGVPYKQVQLSLLSLPSRACLLRENRVDVVGKRRLTTIRKTNSDM